MVFCIIREWLIQNIVVIEAQFIERKVDMKIQIRDDYVAVVVNMVFAKYFLLDMILFYFAEAVSGA